VTEVAFGYEKLDVYGLALRFGVKVFQLLDHFPAKERFRLCGQAGRSASSIALNIAEGSGRRYRKEFAQYVRIAIGSLFETVANLELSTRLGYLSQSEFSAVREDAKELYFKLIALERYLLGRRSAKPGQSMTT
jgi:four helix bundle protein